ncbi:hypothetical protein F0U59_30030 [Archangium gephyra]|nr:hypothetical protein F0U59_30030 [Archangium gephyra]
MNGSRSRGRAFGRLLLGLCVLASGCDVYDKPHRPVPDTFKAHFADGTPLDRQALMGRPWVINLWVPG